MNEQERRALFAELLSCYQSALYSYIYAVVRNWEDSDDLYQSVCLVLWQKFESFRPGNNFFAWARQIARNKIGDFIRRRRSPKCVSPELLDVLIDSAAELYDDEVESHLVALRRCREKLVGTDDELLHLRYVEELNTVQIADRLQRLQPNVSRSLNRIRRWLTECVRMELARQTHPRGNSSE